MNNDRIDVAFETLLGELELIVSVLKEEGADAFSSGNYELAEHIIRKLTFLSNFLEKVRSLRCEWSSFLPEGSACREVVERTPEETFRRPILEALIELGGRGMAKEVLDLVGEKMKDVLTKHDLETLPSDPEYIRWRNIAQWCRYRLVLEGLLKNNSPRGVWEI